MEEESSKSGLHISWAKTKVPNFRAGPEAQDLVVNGHTVDGVSEFIYFGSKQSSRVNSPAECFRHIALAAGIMNDLDDVWRQRSLSLHTRFCFYSACVMTVLLYGCETWTPNKRMWAKVQLFHVRCQCGILSMKWDDFIPNVTVAATSGLDRIINIVRVR